MRHDPDDPVPAALHGRLTPLLSLRETAPGTLRAVLRDPVALARLRAREPATLSLRAADELDREIHVWTLQRRGDGIAAVLRHGRTRATLDIAWEDPEALEITLRQTPKIRFFAALHLAIGPDLALRSAARRIGVHHAAEPVGLRVLGRSDRALLILGTVNDPDGFEDIARVRLALEIGGRIAALDFDPELNRIAFDGAGWDGDCPFDMDHCDIEYFTNQVRVLAALRRDHEQALAPRAVLEAHDHFLGPVARDLALNPAMAPPLPTFQSHLEKSAALRARGTGWVAALGSHRTAFPNSAVMAKRPALPLVHPQRVADPEIRARYTRPDWIPAEAIAAHFENEPQNGPLVFSLFPVTHLMWSYSGQTEALLTYVPNVNRAIGMGGLSFKPENDSDIALEDVAALDFDLRPEVIPSWKIAFPHGREILSPLRAPYWTLVERRLGRFIASGATSVQMDDYPNAGVCVTYGGDFCPESLAGFADFLRALPAETRDKAGLPGDLSDFDYRAWLMAEHGVRDAADYMARRERLPTTRLFRAFQWQVALGAWRRVRATLDRLSPERHITLTSNGAPDWPAPEAYAYVSAIVDAMCAEIHTYPQRPRPDVAAINAYCMTDGLGTRVAAVPKGEENTLTSVKPFNDKRILHIAESYAFGHQLMVPWGNWRKDVKRLYARWQEAFGVTFPFDRDESFSTEPPDRVGAAFDFVRDNAAWLDGFQRYANVAVALRYGTPTIKTRYIARRLLAEHVQFTYVFADPGLHPRVLTDRIAAAFDRILPADALSDYAQGSGIRGPGAVYDAGDAGRALPRPVWCSDPQVYVTIMQKTGPGGRRETVLHLLNRHYDPAGEGRAVPVDELRLRLRRAVAGPGARVAHRALGGAADLTCRETDEDYILRLTGLRYWAMVHFDAPDAA